MLHRYSTNGEGWKIVIGIGITVIGLIPFQWYFLIRVADVVKVEREEPEHSYQSYIWDSGGKRYWLTSNYENPVDDFIDALKDINPAIVEIRT